MPWLKTNDGEYEFTGIPKIDNNDSDDSDDDTMFSESFTKEDRDELRDWLEDL